eukprot:TRINITY_DN15172_c0_g1_i1.p1 TRINITY_DN15172_c0_g1~~TRINITY_DN15172_c0_g1_i1.p1  ORF type:complete len:167 (+),score=33.07 TRINITY_DN15172_c0_g1_i1:92-592(+)
MASMVVMGVCGTGKTTVGTKLASALNAVYEEGDAYHPESNVAKMKRGEPLNDDDRAPWLQLIAIKLAEYRSKGIPCVFACSALKQKYRDILDGGSGQVTFVFLYGTQEVLAQRMTSRQGHFMPATLLVSQFATLEPPQAGPRVFPANVDTNSPDEIVAAVVQFLRQ